MLPDSAVNTYAAGRSSSYRYTYKLDGTLDQVIAFEDKTRYTYSDFQRQDESSFQYHPCFTDCVDGVFTADTSIGNEWFTLFTSQRKFDGQGRVLRRLEFARDRTTGELMMTFDQSRRIDSVSGFWLQDISITRKDKGYDTVVTEGSVLAYDKNRRLISQRSRYEARDFIYDHQGKLDSVIVYWGFADSSYRPTYLFTQIETFDRKPWQPTLRGANATSIYPNLGVKSAKFYERDSSGWKYYQSLKQDFDSEGRWIVSEDGDHRVLIDYFPEGGRRIFRNESLKDGSVGQQLTSVRTYAGSTIIDQRDTLIDGSTSWPSDTSKKHSNSWTFYYNTSSVAPRAAERPTPSRFLISRSSPNVTLLPPLATTHLFSCAGQHIFTGSWEVLISHLPTPGLYSVEIEESALLKRYRLLVAP